VGKWGRFRATHFRRSSLACGNDDERSCRVTSYSVLEPSLTSCHSSAQTMPWYEQFASEGSAVNRYSNRCRSSHYRCRNANTPGPSFRSLILLQVMASSQNVVDANTRKKSASTKSAGAFDSPLYRTLSKTTSLGSRYLLEVRATCMSDLVNCTDLSMPQYNSWMSLMKSVRNTQATDLCPSLDLFSASTTCHSREDPIAQDFRRY
jgi:hypothetical protein